jgi:hypothetical protein
MHDTHAGGAEANGMSACAEQSASLQAAATLMYDRSIERSSPAPISHFSEYYTDDSERRYIGRSVDGEREKHAHRSTSMCPQSAQNVTVPRIKVTAAVKVPLVKKQV